MASGRGCRRQYQVFCTWLERFLPVKDAGIMPDPLNRQRGFSLPEVMLAMVLMIMIVTTLSGYQRALMNSFLGRNQYQQLWRYAWQQSQLHVFSLPLNWQVNRMQTTQAGCVSINVKITSPMGRQGQMTRLHCSNRQ